MEGVGEKEKDKKEEESTHCEGSSVADASTQWLPAARMARRPETYLRMSHIHHASGEGGERGGQ